MKTSGSYEPLETIFSFPEKRELIFQGFPFFLESVPEITPYPYNTYLSNPYNTEPRHIESAT